jgi:hypothetical protein
MCGHPDPFGSVRDVGLVSARCSAKSEVSEGCPPRWLPAWLPADPARRPSASLGTAPVTARTVQGMAPYPGQARCLALGFWPECFRRLNVKGGRRPFPKETRSALDIEGKHVTIQGPSPDLSPATTFAPSPVMPRGPAQETGSGVPQASSAKGGRTKCAGRIERGAEPPSRKRSRTRGVQGVELPGERGLRVLL